MEREVSPLRPDTVAFRRRQVPGTTISAFVGATVSPAAAQVAGNYTGTVTMSVVYF